MAVANDKNDSIWIKLGKQKLVSKVTLRYSSEIYSAISASDFFSSKEVTFGK